MFGAASRTFFSSQAPAYKWMFGTFVLAAEKPEEKKTMVRRRELPIYVEEKPCITCIEREQAEPNLLERTVGCARQELLSLYNETTIIKNDMHDLRIVIQEKAEEIAKTIWAEGNDGQKAIAISAAAVISYYYGFRRLWKTRVLQAIIGGTAVASILYPNEFKRIVNEKIALANEIIDDLYYNEEKIEERPDNLKD